MFGKQKRGLPLWREISPASLLVLEKFVGKSLISNGRLGVPTLCGENVFLFATSIFSLSTEPLCNHIRRHGVAFSCASSTANRRRWPQSVFAHAYDCISESTTPSARTEPQWYREQRKGKKKQISKWKEVLFALCFPLVPSPCHFHVFPVASASHAKWICI